MQRKSFVRLCVAGLLVGWMLSVSGAPAFGEEVYVATLEAPRGLRTSRIVSLRLTIDRYSNQDDADKYTVEPTSQRSLRNFL